MSYLVLARKYRPQTFAGVVGQGHVTRTLANAFEQDRVHHAFLLCGPRGVGKTTLARILGKALNCERGQGSEPCGQCPACESITNGSAVDYIEMDGASNRGIDAVRELNDAARYQPAALRKKVYVIDEVHMLTTEAFNALLKTLEEPPEHVTFVLATTEPHKVPNTVLSRCQRYDFKLVPAPLLSAHVGRILAEEGLEAEPGAVRLIVRESGGSVRDALSLCDQVISFVGSEVITEVRVAELLGVADRALTRALVTALADGNAADALVAVDSAIERGVDEVQIARAVVRYLRDLAAVQVMPESDQLVEGSAEELRELAEQAGRIDRRRVMQMFDRMMRACADLARIPQPRLVLDLALLDVASLEPLLPLGDLLDRLAELERSLGQAPPGSKGGSSGRGRRRSAGRASRGASSATAGSGVEQSGGAGTSRGASSATAGSGVEQPGGAGTSRGASSATAGSGVEQPGGAGSSVAPGARQWEAIIAALGGDPRRLPLVRIYENARVLEWSRAKIELGFPADALDADSAISGDRVAALKQFLGEHLGRSVALSVRLLDGAEAEAASSAPSAADLEKRRVEEERARCETEAREHPLTKMVVETFGASIREIKTDV
jgi:DNA polymerase-3 subunit gamma/tau